MSSLVSTHDPYNGRTIKSCDNYAIFNGDKILFEKCLKDSLESWRINGIRGVWFEILLQHSEWINICAKLGFKFHNARDDRLVMTNWLPLNEPNSLPFYPFTQIGVGGIIRNERNEILLMKEKRGHYFGWKFPGGLLDPGEHLYEAIEREVCEETGVKCHASNVISFRHMHKFRYPECSDIYFVCLLRPKPGTNLEPNPNQNETGACRWFSREQISQLPETEFSPFCMKMLQLYDEHKDKEIDKIELISNKRMNIVYCLKNV